MNTTINSSGYLPLSQPFDQEPWNYDGDENVTSIPNANIVDWVLVELRETLGNADDARFYTVVERQAAFLKNDGSIVGLNGSSKPSTMQPLGQNLYVVLWHRNHCEIMSANALPGVNGIYNYDFTVSSDDIYGSVYGCKHLPSGSWGMISGDGTGEGSVDNRAKNDIWILQNGSTGYLSGDYNIDGIVDDADLNSFWLPNTGLGSQVK